MLILALQNALDFLTSHSVFTGRDLGEHSFASSSVCFTCAILFCDLRYSFGRWDSAPNRITALDGLSWESVKNESPPIWLVSYPNQEHWADVLSCHETRQENKLPFKESYCGKEKEKGNRQGTYSILKWLNFQKDNGFLMCSWCALNCPSHFWLTNSPHSMQL